MGYCLKKHFIFFLLIFSPSLLAAEQLVFSVDLIRHGDRTPIIELPTAPYHWKEGLGALTKTGHQQEVALGEKLRNKYVNEYHLLTPYYQKENIYVRSTDRGRTIASAHALLLGLYPKNDREPNQKIMIHTVNLLQDDLLAARPSKNILSKMKVYFLNEMAWRKVVQQYQDKLKEWANKTGVPLNSLKNFEDLADNLRIKKRYHLPMPANLDPEDINLILSLGETIMVNKFKMDVITYPMGHVFLKAIEHYVDNVIKQKTSLRYVLFSGHDSSIMTVMSALGVPLNSIPEYASRVNFSLFKDDSGEYFIRISYNDMPVILPSCPLGDCSIQAFSQLANH